MAAPESPCPTSYLQGECSTKLEELLSLLRGTNDRNSSRDGHEKERGRAPDEDPALRCGMGERREAESARKSETSQDEARSCHPTGTWML